MRKENAWLVGFGIILLLIGLGASFYKETQYVKGVGWQPLTPYQSVGVILLVAGIILIAVGLLAPLRLENR